MTTSMESSWESVERLLCVRLDAMGDVLMTSPAMAALKNHGPKTRHLTLLTSRSGAEAARLLPCVDEIILAEVPWMKAAAPAEHAKKLTRLARTLKEGRFDAAVIFTVYSQSALPAAMLCLLAGIPRRLAHCRENPYHLLSDWIPDPEPSQRVRHEVRRQLDLVQPVCGTLPDTFIRIQVPVQARWNIKERMAPLGKNWIVMHPGATAASRRYPASSFAEVAATLHHATGCTVVFTGDAGEADMIEDIRKKAAVPALSLAGRLSLAEMAALVEQAPLLICNNTGPAHLAAATGTPVVCLYALTNPQHTPWMARSKVLFHDVACRYCYKSICPMGHHHCLERVTPLTVANAALELMGRHTCVYLKALPEPQLPPLALPLPA